MNKKSKHEIKDALTSVNWYQDYQRFVQLKGLEKRSQHSYTEWVINLAHFYQTCDLPSLEPVKVLDYLIYLKDDRRYAAGTINQALNGLRGLYRDHLDFEWDIWRKIKIKRIEPLPHVLNKPSVLLLLQTFTEHDLKMYFTLVYRTGMRLNEARNLKAAHIDGDRKIIRVVKSKSGRQRDIPISENTYLLLREFWKTHRNPNWIFPTKRQNWKRTGLTYRQAAEHSEKPLSESGIQTAINIVAKQSGLLQKHPQVSTHTLRHSFATHMLEAGASVRQVAAVLGHSTLKQTMVYLHLTENSEEDFREKLNALDD